MGTVELAARVGVIGLLYLGPTPQAHASEGPAPAREGPALDTTTEPSEARARGALRLGVGSVLAGAGLTLVAFGVVEFIRAQDHLALCRELEPEPGSGLDIGNPCSFDPPGLGFASAGLSWGLSIPLLVSAGLVLGRGAKLIQTSRERPGPRASVYPWWRRTGGGVGLTLRF